MICLLFFFSIPLIVLPWSTPKKKTNAQTLEKCLEENTAGGSSYEKTCANGESKKLLRSWGANASIRSELQMCASLLWTALFVLQGAARGVSVFLLLWSTEIKELPLPKWTVLVLSILPFQQGRPSPVDTDTILYPCKQADLDGFQPLFVTEPLSKWSVSFWCFLSQLIAQLSSSS